MVTIIDKLIRKLAADAINFKIIKSYINDDINRKIDYYIFRKDNEMFIAWSMDGKTCYQLMREFDQYEFDIENNPYELVDGPIPHDRAIAYFYA